MLYELWNQISTMVEPWFKELREKYRQIHLNVFTVNRNKYLLLIFNTKYNNVMLIMFRRKHMKLLLSYNRVVRSKILLRYLLKKQFNLFEILKTKIYDFTWLGKGFIFKIKPLQSQVNNEVSVLFHLKLKCKVSTNWSTWQYVALKFL